MIYYAYSQRELEAYAKEDKFAEIALRNGLEYREPKGNELSIIPYEVALICFDWRNVPKGKEVDYLGKVAKAAAEADNVSIDYDINVFSNGFTITRVQ